MARLGTHRCRTSGLGAGCSGSPPDVRAEVEVQLLSGYVGAGFPGEMPDVRAVGRRRMSGVDAGCPGHVALQQLGSAVVDISRGRMSGPGPNVRVLGDVSVFFRRHFHASLADGVVEAKKEEDGAAEAITAGHPAPGQPRTSCPNRRPTTSATEHLAPARTSGASATPGHPASLPEIRHPLSREGLELPLQPGHPASRTAGHLAPACA